VAQALALPRQGFKGIFQLSIKKAYIKIKYPSLCQEAGLEITNAQIAELEACVEDVDIRAAEEEERKTKHDVMAHLHIYASQCPLASPIIHLGATSCYIGDNTVCIQYNIQKYFRNYYYFFNF